MQHLLADLYEPRMSLLHRLPAGEKLAATFLFVVAVALAPRFAWGACAAAALLVVIAAALSRVPARRLLRRLAWLEPFALGVALLALLQPGGLRVFASLLIKSTLCLCAMIILAATTRFTEMLGTLWRARVPPLLVTTIALAHRYLFLLADEQVRMVRAQKSRTFASGRGAAWRRLAAVVAQLFVRSSDRAERVYAAMCARGWRT